MNRKAMLIAAHPDDAEIGMGGTIAALAAANQDITVVDLTNGEPTPFGSPEIRARETAQASKILGLKSRIMLDIKNREVFDTVENRIKLANKIREHTPDILFIPYGDDAHPDHIKAHDLCLAARFYAKFEKGDLSFQAHYPRRVFYYFSLHARLKIQPSFIFDISNYIDQKMEALAAYASQFTQNPRNVKALELFKTEAAYWGSQIGAPYGEPFLCKEHLKLAAPESLFEI